jgi:hypothetical protein
LVKPKGGVAAAANKSKKTVKIAALGQPR